MHSNGNRWDPTSEAHTGITSLPIPSAGSRATLSVERAWVAILRLAIGRKPDLSVSRMNILKSLSSCVVNGSEDLSQFSKLH